MTPSESSEDPSQESVVTRPLTARGRENVAIRIKLSRDDADRLIQAFRDGKLAELGVLEIQQVADSGEKQWAASEEVKKGKGSTSAAKHGPSSK